jgi:hypothetical protein
VNITDYLTNVRAVPFGPLSWVLLVVQVILLVAGLYYVFLRTESSPLRARLFKQLGYALAGLGALGSLFGLLRLMALAPFTARYWSLIVVAFELALAFYALYYSRAIYPAQAAQVASKGKGARRSAVQASARPALSANGAGGSKVVMVDEPRVASGRRDARRDRKRRNK